MKTLITIILAITLSACTTGADGKRTLSPAAQAALDRLGEDTLTIGEGAIAGAAGAAIGNATSQSLAGGQFDSSQLGAAAAAGALNGVAAGIRTLETQRAQTAVSPVVLQTTIASTGGPAAPASVIQGVSGAIVAAVAQGAPVNTALETAAKKLDAAAAKVPAGTPLPPTNP